MLDKYIRGYYGISFVCAQIPIMYAFNCDGGRLPSTYRRWIEDMGSLKSSDLEVMKHCNKITHWKSGGDGCISNHLQYLRICVPKAFQLYFKVYAFLFAVSTVRFGFNFPDVKMLISMCRSVAFLCAYIMGSKITSCLIPVPALRGILCGIVSGCSIYIETPSRRSSLFYYCLPFALHVLFLRRSKTVVASNQSASYTIY